MPACRESARTVVEPLDRVTKALSADRLEFQPVAEDPRGVVVH